MVVVVVDDLLVCWGLHIKVEQHLTDVLQFHPKKSQVNPSLKPIFFCSQGQSGVVNVVRRFVNGLDTVFLTLTETHVPEFGTVRFAEMLHDGRTETG